MIIAQTTPADIKTTEDVKSFFMALIQQESVNFHPDTPFNDYIDEKGNETYTEQEAAHRDSLMDKCFDVCIHDDDLIYQLAIEVAPLG